jgi:hypothetical protein
MGVVVWEVALVNWWFFGDGEKGKRSTTKSQTKDVMSEK